MRRERADGYEAYNHEVGIKPLIWMALGVPTFRKDRKSETEYITISYSDSIKVMTAFARLDPVRIHHLERDKDFLIELPRTVKILQLRASHYTTV